MTYRNQALTRLASGQACIWCGIQDDTVVWAHSNLQEHGKGMGIKAHDAAGMLLCNSCHTELDHGKNLSKGHRRLVIIELIAKTHMRLWELGLVEVAR